MHVQICIYMSRYIAARTVDSVLPMPAGLPCSQRRLHKWKDDKDNSLAVCHIRAAAEWRAGTSCQVMQALEEFFILLHSLVAERLNLLAVPRDAHAQQIHGGLLCLADAEFLCAAYDISLLLVGGM